MDAVLTPARATTSRDVEWFHCLFVRDGRAISCGVHGRGDGAYAVSVLRLWTAEQPETEIFLSPGEALKRHAQISRYLQASGWLIVEAGTVKTAA